MKPMLEINAASSLLQESNEVCGICIQRNIIIISCLYLPSKNEAYEAVPVFPLNST